MDNIAITKNTSQMTFFVFVSVCRYPRRTLGAKRRGRMIVV